MELNGVLVDINTNEIICMGYGTIREVRKAIEILQERKIVNLTTALTYEKAMDMMPGGIGTFPYITPENLAKIDMSEVRAIQKMVDGVMIRVYHHNGTWKIMFNNINAYYPSDKFLLSF